MQTPLKSETRTEQQPGTLSYLRFPVPTRILHWLSAAAIFVLLWSGFWIFNIHPRLYWGEVGYFGSPAIAEIVADTSTEPAQMAIRVGDASFDVTGIMGRVNRQPFVRVFNFPQGFQYGATRALHFTAAWVLVVSWLVYLYHLVSSGRLRRTWLPSRQELSPANLGRDLLNHLKLHRPKGDAARQYNTLQKLSYLLVMLLLLPLVFLSGLTMSNSVTTAWPFLFDLFGGRQSARTMHFVFASLTVFFILIHVLQLFVVGIVNHLRAMITGRLKISMEED
ncbi:MAG: cytochrome b/b6 domain-containing protein [Gammaproteobacteria bacterium]|nr:cytochrome b/b6 domain-containing protein [Pseudomonadales bacterium]